MIKICKYFILIILCFTLEIWWFNSFKIYSIIPNIFLCLLVKIFVNETINEPILADISKGYIFAFFGGFIESSLLSTYAPLISYIIIVPLAKVTKRYIQNDLLYYLGNILFASLIYEFSMWIMTFSKNINFSYNMFQVGIQLLYNIIIAIIIFIFCEIFNLNKKQISL